MELLDMQAPQHTQCTASCQSIITTHGSEEAGSLLGRLWSRCSMGATLHSHSQHAARCISNMSHGTADALLASRDVHQCRGSQCCHLGACTQPAVACARQAAALRRDEAQEVNTSAHTLPVPVQAAARAQARVSSAADSPAGISVWANTPDTSARGLLLP